jgi:hypothetical protein
MKPDPVLVRRGRTASAGEARTLSIPKTFEHAVQPFAGSEAFR